MSFQEAVTTVLTKKYADFNGRARRSEFWWFALFNAVVTTVFNIIDKGINTSIPGFIVSLALLLPGLAVAARRLHDTGRSGWWLLLIFAIVVGWIVLLVWYIAEGDQGDNQYGPSPKAVGGGFNPNPNANWS